MMCTALLDQAGDPSVRATILRLLANAASADLAISHVRLGALDLGESRLEQVHCRILLASIDCASISRQPLSPGGGAPRLERVLELALSGRLQARCSGLSRWSPDFSVYRAVGPDSRDLALLGGHYFRALFTHGTVITAVLRERAHVQRLARHFEELWVGAYDVLPLIVESLRSAQTFASDASSHGSADSGQLAGPFGWESFSSAVGEPPA